MLLDTIKARIKTAMLSKNDAERNILRVLLGESQTLESRQGGITDEQVVKIAKKMIDNNNETIAALPKEDPRCAALANENIILSSLVPKELTAQDIEAFLLNSDNPEYEQIQNAKADGQAIGIAMKTLKAAGLPVDGKLVGEVVKKIRSSK